jgi:hypothetical protein
VGCGDRLLVTMRREFVAQLLQVYREDEKMQLASCSTDATAQLVYIVTSLDINPPSR